MIFKTGSNTLPGTGCLIRNDLNLNQNHSLMN